MDAAALEGAGASAVVDTLDEISEVISSTNAR
jgi:hypothetical protein